MREIPCKFVEIHPGDGTRYEVLVADLDEEYLMVGSSLASCYQLRKDSIEEAYPYVAGLKPVTRKEMRDFGPPEALDENLEEELRYHYIWYVAEHCGMDGNRCNPWTARALILAAHAALEEWRLEEALDE